MVTTNPPSTEPRVPPAQAVEGLAAKLRGDVIAPTDAPFDEARGVWNGTVDRRPALIVQPRGVADVIDAVKFAREHGLQITARGGGHHVAGSAVGDGALVVDLTHMRSVRVDPEARTVRAEAGALLADLDRETQAFGLVVPAGVVSDTGIAGLTLAGGVGWLRRKWGLTSDNVISADIVTADGRFRRVSPTQDADLFWALRGGGWNMGVVTSFEYRAHALGPEVAFAFVFYHTPSNAETRDLLQQLRAYNETAPDEIGTLSFAGTFPDEAPFPDEVHGQPFFCVSAVYAGGVDEGLRALQPLRELGRPALDLSGPWQFVDVQKVLDEDYPTGRRYYWKSSYLRGLPDEAVDVLVDYAGNRPSPLTTIDVWHQGGALARVAPEDTPVGHRDAGYLIGIESNWDDPTQDEANVAWARDLARALEPYSTGGSYLNFELPDEEAKAASYGASYARLREIKAKYDPDGLFR